MVNSKTEIISWLKYEKLELTEQKNPKADFEIRITNVYGSGVNVVIIRMKGKDAVGITVNLVQSKEITELFSKLKEIDQTKFTEYA